MKANGAPEKYISKSDLVAEIEKWLGETDKGFPNDHNLGRYDMCKQILSFIDILEVKEVDLSNSFDATVCKFGSIYLKEMDRDAIVKALEPYKDGDKVKVIIIKDE